ncbi:MAG: Hsp20/alpha crystallin family protein, partial [Candidatus Aminicenantia bacterium]
MEKLKKGMEIEESIEEKPSEAGNSQRRREGKEEKKKGMKKTKESKIKTLSIGLETGKREKPNTDKAMEKEKVQIKKPPAKDKPSSAPSFVKATAAPSEAGDSQRRKEGKEKWPEPEGQLAVDVYQTESELVIQSAIAGVKPEDLTISIEKDIFTIRGERKKSSEEGGDYFTQECY